MAWVDNIKSEDGRGRAHPTQVEARAKIFQDGDGRTIIQIDTTGSGDRENPGKLSQTLQFGEEAASQLFDLLRRTYGFT